MINMRFEWTSQIVYKHKHFPCSFLLVLLLLFAATSSYMCALGHYTTLKHT